MLTAERLKMAAEDFLEIWNELLTRYFVKSFFSYNLDFLKRPLAGTLLSFVHPISWSEAPPLSNIELGSNVLRLRHGKNSIQNEARRASVFADHRSVVVIGGLIVEAGPHHLECVFFDVRDASLYLRFRVVGQVVV